MSKKRDLIGMRFGRLIVTKEASSYITSGGYYKAMWYCDCDCGTKDKIIPANSLLSGNTKSCGCLIKERNTWINRERKLNRYDLETYDYGVGWSNNDNKEFYFDKEDYEKIKDYLWRTNSHGYIITKYNGKQIALHRFIMDASSEDIIDHIGHNLVDNRKSQLRIVNKSQNGQNMKRRIDNSSGVTGVYFDSSKNKWIGEISINNKYKRLGCFNNFNDAVKARKDAEEKYYGEYSYDNSMRIAEQYNIEELN